MLSYNIFFRLQLSQPEEGNINIQNGEGTYKITQNGTYTIIAKDEYDKETRLEITIDKIRKLGDGNQNGKIDISDYIALLRHIAATGNNNLPRKWILSSEQQVLADVTQDGELNISDIVRYRRHLAASGNSNIANKYPKWIIPSE